MQNITSQIQEQACIDQQILQHLYALEVSVLWLGEHQEALWTRQQLECDLEYHRFCVTPLPYNDSYGIWSLLKNSLLSAFTSPLGRDINALQKKQDEQMHYLKTREQDETLQWLTQFIPDLSSSWFTVKNLQQWILPI